MAGPAAPFRVVESACTRDGAGHSGTIQSRPWAASAAAIGVSFLTGGDTRGRREQRAGGEKPSGSAAPRASQDGARGGPARGPTQAQPTWGTSERGPAR